MPMLAARSPKPRISASRRSEQRAISSTLPKPSASSISTSKPMDFLILSFLSSDSSMVSKNSKSEGFFTLGMMMMSSLSPAPSRMLTMSYTAHSVSWSFTRTARRVRPQSSSLRPSMAICRAPSLAAGAVASSKSRNTRSASDPAAFSTNFGLEAGTASSDRRSRLVMVGHPVLSLGVPCCHTI